MKSAAKFPKLRRGGHVENGTWLDFFRLENPCIQNVSYFTADIVSGVVSVTNESDAETLYEVMIYWSLQ